MEKHRDRKENLYIIFIYLEKTNNRVPREVLWWVFFFLRLDQTKYMCHNFATSIKIISRRTESFYYYRPISRLTIKSLFICFSFGQADKACLRSNPLVISFYWWCNFSWWKHEDANLKLEMWRNTLETKNFKLNSVKMEYIRCNFNYKINRNEGRSRIGNIEIRRSRNFLYLSTII